MFCRPIAIFKRIVIRQFFTITPLFPTALQVLNLSNFFYTFLRKSSIFMGELKL